MKELTIKDATHVLECRHCNNGPNQPCKEYTMDCIPIKDMGDGRAKVLVFGDRNWKWRDYKKRIRYVDAKRLVPKVK